MLPLIKTRTAWPNLIDELLNDNFLPGFHTGEQGTSTPAVNIIEENDNYRIEVAAPGLSKDDFKITIENDTLTISSEKEEKHESDDEKVMRREFSYSNFCRSFVLPEGVNEEKIKARNKDGILQVEVPKREEAKVKPVKEIKIA